MTSLRLAARLAYSPDPRQRWRQIGLVLAALIGTLVLLLCAAALNTSARSVAHQEARGPTFADTMQDGRLIVRAQAAIQPGFGQFPVVWLQPLGGVTPTEDVVPPGLSRLPGPGEAVLSPGLRDAGYTASTFGLADSTAGTGPGGAIGVDGLSSLTEGFVYARPVEGRELTGTVEAGTLFTGYHGGPGLPLETFPDVPSTGTTLIAVTAAGVVPAVLLLFGAARSLSQLRTDRGRALFALGLRPSRIRRVLALETLLLAAPGALAAALVATVWFPRIQQVPLGGPLTLPGSWALSPMILAAVLLAALGLIALCGQAQPVRPRVRTGPRKARPWLVLPLLAGLIAMSAEPFINSIDLKQTTVMIGLTLVIIGLPLGLPQLSLIAAARMDRSTRPGRWLGGRLLRHHAGRLSLPAGIVGSFVVVASTGQAMLAGATVQEPVDTGQPAQGWYLTWTNGEPGDLDLISDAAGNDLVLLAPDPDRPGGEMIRDCADADRLAAWYDVTGCIDGRPTPELLDTLEQAIFYPVRLAPTDWQETIDPAQAGATILAPIDLTELEIRAQLPGQIPGLFLSAQLDAPGFEDPIRPWIFTWWIAATGLLLLVMARETAERAMRAAAESTRLIAVGLRTNEGRRVFAWTLTVPMVIAVPIGLAAALIFIRYGARAQLTPELTTAILTVALTSAALGILTSLAVVALAARDKAG